jgi:hypothetical protein
LRWGNFLSSVPQQSDYSEPWDVAMKKRLSLSDKQIDVTTFFRTLVNFNLEKIRLEEVLLAVHAISHPASRDQPLFKKEHGGKDNVFFVFEKLGSHALNILNKRVSRRKNIDRTTAMYLLSSILLLLASSNEVKNSKSLQSLKKNANVDWVTFLSKV